METNHSGLYEYRYEFNGGNSHLDCQLEHQPFEPDSEFDPGQSESMTLIAAVYAGTDFADMLHPSKIEDIEAEALHDLREKAKDACAEAAISRFEARQEAAAECCA